MDDRPIYPQSVLDEYKALARGEQQLRLKYVALLADIESALAVGRNDREKVEVIERRVARFNDEVYPKRQV